MKYAHVISAVMGSPWAILPGTLQAIAEVLARREAGVELSDEEIRERIGALKTDRRPHFLAEDGTRLEEQDGQLLAVGGIVGASGSSSAGRGKLVAVLPVYGIIAPKAAEFQKASSGGGTGIDALTQQFRSAMQNPDVKCVVLDFDSPGGNVFGVSELANEIRAAREQKRIVAQLSPLAASAAYWLASQASEVVITPSGQAGSIGVFSAHTDMSKAMEMKGVKMTLISAGKFKTEGNNLEPLTEEGFAAAKGLVDTYYNMFTKDVADGRGVSVSDVKNGFGEGRMVDAVRAKKLGLVDRIATLDETLARLGVTDGSTRVAIAASTNVAQLNAAERISTTASAETSTEVEMNKCPKCGAVIDASHKHCPSCGHNLTAAADAAEISASQQAERDRCSRIMQLAAANNMLDKAEGWIAANKSVQDVQAEILNALSPLVVAQPSAEQRAEASRIQVMRDAADKLPNDLLFARVCRAYAAAKGDRHQAALFATHVYHDARVAHMFEAAVDPQRASDFASGGFLLGDNLSASVVELLRPKSVVRSLNPTLAPLVDGVLTLPKLTGGASSNYVGESKLIKAAKITGGQVKFSSKTLATIVVISNKLLRSPSANADSLVRNDSIRSMSQKEDVTFIRSMGTEYTPKGLKALAGTTFTAKAEVTAANVIADLHKAMETVESADVDVDTCGWILSPRTKHYLMQLRDGVGGFLYKDEMLRGTLEGYPFRATSQIPKNLGGNGNASEIYFAAFGDVVIADAPQVAIEYTSEASIDDGAGNVTPLFQTDQSAIKVLVEHDMNARHNEAIVVIDGVTWGA